MDHLDLCSGIGGFALAARWIGWKTIGFAEIDEFASRVLEKHWPGVPNYGDIRSVPDGTRADIITAGFPCQPYSCAGKRLGDEDDRAIWTFVIEVVKRVQPRWCVFENVAGIINMALDGVLSDLEAEGYEVGTVVVPACAVNAPHRRDRVWIVAHSGNFGSRTGERPEICRERKEATSGGEALADAYSNDRHRRSGYVQVGRCRSESKAALDGQPAGVERLAKPCLGREVDGLPGWLDGAWDGDWERGVPRVSTGVKDRAKRLKALGNAIVPQVVFQIFRSIAESDRVSS